MNHLNQPWDDTIVDVRANRASSQVVLVCEHASPYIPERFKNLGLPDDALRSHVAWDPGALALAERMAEHLGAALLAAKTSRLVYDCNRPPEAQDAMPERSEVVDVPGNFGLSSLQKAERVETYYKPFRAAVSHVISRLEAPVLVTVHSFTPIYHDARRDVEIGVLHDRDARLADALLSCVDGQYVVRRNEPYGPDDGVTHTLKEHALPGGHLNVMLEVRNDLIADQAGQSGMADLLSGWLKRALVRVGVTA
ncbi:N-formylglutamate amidohydrolase [Tateyamaria omphalii]|uniref:N-formylglutamate amidohydrolase n=1 Tax=Tateyamaria omphalii TaxID=299262 RepID=UPI001C9A1E7B|nr:N-formylglutamate amidohydrolase [Tateyamaria omphalii]MBY5935147.1 N-formylglutamate amidohydrolase [Tateyamaria omphalii]